MIRHGLDCWQKKEEKKNELFFHHPGGENGYEIPSGGYIIAKNGGLATTFKYRYLYDLFYGLYQLWDYVEVEHACSIR